MVGFPKTDPIDNEGIISLPTDILIPAAVEGQIYKDNAENVRAKIMLEGANGPTTLEADEILKEKKVFVVPDILANSGGVAVSYLEWIQNIQRFFFTEEEIHEKTEKRMKKAFWNVVETMEKHGLTMREAAYILAVGRLAEPLRALGRAA